MAYRASSLRGLAIAQTVFGSLMFVFGAASAAFLDHWISSIGFGIWVGIWTDISGSLGYIGAKNDSIPNKCLIGCFMGFSIVICVLTGAMFISYCIALAELNEIINCKNRSSDWNYGYYNKYKSCYSSSSRYLAKVGLGIGSCMLIFAIAEFITALTSAIYCCGAVCCNSSTGVMNTSVTNQQVMYVQPVQQPQHTLAWEQGRATIQPTGAVTITPHGYPVAGQPAMYLPQQPAVHMPMQQPPYFAASPGSVPAGAVNMSYAGAAGTQQPPPHSHIQTGNPPPLAGSSGDTSSRSVPAHV